MANKAHVPTAQNRQQIQTMAGFGLPQDRIARIIGLSEPTLRKHYREELDLGTDKANLLVAQSLFDKATSKAVTGPTVAAAIFWLKTRAGWKETSTHEHTGPGGGAIQITISSDDANL